MKGKKWTSNSNEELYRVMEEILEEVGKLFPLGKIGKWVAMAEVRGKKREELLSFFEKMAEIGSRAILKEDERELVKRIHERFVASGKEREIWDGLSAKLKRMGLM
jgi:Lhr-like helicase